MINKLDKLLIDCISQKALKSKYVKHLSISRYYKIVSKMINHKIILCFILKFL
jgi:hypothetical protein